MKTSWKQIILPAIALIMSIPSAAPAGFTNGSFESYIGGSGTNGNTPSQLGNNATGGYTKLNGWDIGANTYGFLMAPGSADKSGAYSPQFSNSFSIWGKNNGGVDNIPISSPDKGNFVVLDGAANYRGTGISQTITDLAIGQQYAVSFYWASGQQKNYDGETDESLQVSFGNQKFTTASEHNVSHGFTDWTQQTFVFTADATSNTLNFLALSPQGGLPPLVLLDGVSFSAVPEPGSLALVSLGLVGAAVSNRVRRRKNISA